MYEVINQSKDTQFLYMMLDRLRSDCEYYLGNGNRCDKYLWTGNPKSQIELMRYVYDKLPEQPQWLSKEDINSYESKMLNKGE